MAERWLDRSAVTKRLETFFGTQHSNLAMFGSTVNQTFEAFVFSQVISWYRGEGWTVTLVSPPKSKPGTVSLKFSTRGRPARYTFARCVKPSTTVQVRHGLRVATRHHTPQQKQPANVCLDVAVIDDLDLAGFGTDDAVKNEHLRSFGEAKHMSAFAELVASFLGLVHELLPEHLVTGSATVGPRDHPRPFLYVSGHLYRTAAGIKETIEARKLDVEVHDHESSAFHASPLATRPAPPRARKKSRRP